MGWMSVANLACTCVIFLALCVQAAAEDKCYLDAKTSQCTVRDCEGGDRERYAACADATPPDCPLGCAEKEISDGSGSVCAVKGYEGGALNATLVSQRNECKEEYEAGLVEQITQECFDAAIAYSMLLGCTMKCFEENRLARDYPCVHADSGECESTAVPPCPKLTGADQFTNCIWYPEDSSCASRPCSGQFAMWGYCYGFFKLGVAGTCPPECKSKELAAGETGSKPFTVCVPADASAALVSVDEFERWETTCGGSQTDVCQEFNTDYLARMGCDVECRAGMRKWNDRTAMFCADLTEEDCTFATAPCDLPDNAPAEPPSAGDGGSDDLSASEPATVASGTAAPRDAEGTDDTTSSDGSSSGRSPSPGLIAGGTVAATAAIAALAVLTYCCARRRYGPNVASQGGGGVLLASAPPEAFCSVSQDGALDGAAAAAPAEGIKVAVQRATGAVVATTGSTVSTLRATSVDGVWQASALSSGEVTAQQLLDMQLDFIEAVRGGHLLRSIRIGGRNNRRHGGQGTVVFGHVYADATRPLAVKFFFDGVDYHREVATASIPELRDLMPPVYAAEESLVERSTESFPPPLNAAPLPPLMVTEKGESLSDFCLRRHPDFFTAIQLMMHIGEKLTALHAAGWVHRDLKPGNTIWLLSQNRWALIDFGCAARAGDECDLSFSLYFAAPEVIAAYKSQATSIVANSAVDVWAFGIMVYELLTQSKFHGVAADSAAVVRKLTGQQPLTTEQPLSEEAWRGLGNTTIRTTVAAMLHRDPAQRPRVADLVVQWTGMLQRTMKAEAAREAGV